MDVFTFATGATLVTTGWFIYQDYARSLSSDCLKYAEVIAVETNRPPASAPFSSLQNKIQIPSIFPILEYHAPGAPVQFTSLDSISNRPFHVGDSVFVKFSRGWKQGAHVGMASRILITILSILLAVLLVSSLMNGITLGPVKICLASIIVTLSISMFVIHFRLMDARVSDTDMQRENIIAIAEPSASCHWINLLDSLVQKRKVWGAKCFGLGFLFSGAIMATGGLVL